MAHQLFGSVETEKGLARAMLCIDADRPLEYMINIWGSGEPPYAFLADAQELAETIQLRGRLLFRTHENGALFLPKLSADEVARVRGMQTTLSKSETGGLAGRWTSADGRGGAITFDAPLSDTQFEAYQCTDWADFKRWASISRAERGIGLYRGHGSSDYRLKTTLHRAGRNRLDRYCAESLGQFHAEAEAVLGMRFNMNDGGDYATVFGLAQHHGLPTPLLDWTSSPYIAAFFAFADVLDSVVTGKAALSAKVRIYALTQQFVQETTTPVVVVPITSPYISSLAIAPRYNERLRAQQGHFLVTNVADVENWIRKVETELGAQYLFAADVPARYACEALEDLSYMGLTAATLFPGLDGVCKKIRHAMTFKAPAIAEVLEVKHSEFDKSQL